MFLQKVRFPGAATPFRRPAPNIVLSHPLVEGQARQVAVQLAAGYGSDALRLARKRADEAFELEDAHQFFDWCLIIAALEELEKIDEPVTHARA